MLANTYCDDAEIASSALLWEGLPKKWRRGTAQRRVRFPEACRPGQVQAGSLAEVAFGPPSALFWPFSCGDRELRNVMGLSLDLAFEPVTVWEGFMTTSRRWEASPHHHITVSPDPQRYAACPA